MGDLANNTAQRPRKNHNIKKNNGFPIFLGIKKCFKEILHTIIEYKSIIFIQHAKIPGLVWVLASKIQARKRDIGFVDTRKTRAEGQKWRNCWLGSVRSQIC